MLVAAKQQVTVHAVTYVNRRLTAIPQSQKGFIPEADVIFGASATFPPRPYAFKEDDLISMFMSSKMEG